MDAAFATTDKRDKPSLDRREIDKFSRIAPQWWDENGPFAPLHRLNPVRLSWIRQQIIKHFSLDQSSLQPFVNLTCLDIGCGGGLTAEPLTRLGGTVTGLDADAEAIAVAAAHASDMGLAIYYRQGTLDVLLAGQQFDVVLALEIVEHVTDVAAFVRDVAARVKPGGLLIMSTLNRTPQSFAFGIVGAEYVMRWLPRGTHNWRRFLKPSELAAHLRHESFDISALSGLVYNPLSTEFSLSENNLSVNYLLAAHKSN